MCNLDEQKSKGFTAGDLVKDRPLVFFDLETTGTNISFDRIIEYSFIKISQDGKKDIRTGKVNPGMHIPEESTAVHRISDEDVKDAPPFKNIAHDLFMFLEGCDLGGYNIRNFDVPMLIKEFSRTNINFSMEGRRVVDAYFIFCQKEPRSLTGAYKFFCGKEFDQAKAHGAEFDTLATVEVFEAQLNRYGDLPLDMDSLHSFCNPVRPDWIDSTGKFKWSAKEPIVGFGQNYGIPLKKIAVDNPGFLQWMLRADFPDDAKKIATEALRGRFPVKPAANPAAQVTEE